MSTIFTCASGHPLKEEHDECGECKCITENAAQWEVVDDGVMEYKSGHVMVMDEAENLLDGLGYFKKLGLFQTDDGLPHS